MNTQIKVLTLPDAETLQRVGAQWLARLDIEIVRMGDAYPHPDGGYVLTIQYRDKLTDSAEMADGANERARRTSW